MRAFLVAILLITTCVDAETIQDNMTINIISRGDSNAAYAIGLLNLAVSKCGKQYKINILNGGLTAMRLKESVRDGTIDLSWTASNQELEDTLIPIRVPLEKGLMGHRILMVHKDNVHLLDQVKTLDDLKGISFGQGRGWTDVDILESNGIRVIKAPKYESLFLMLDGKRFQAFPRGVNEPFAEIELRKNLELAVDENVMLVYTMPYYFFVTPKRPELAADLEKGLFRAIEDGSFDQYFYNDPTTRMVVEKVKMSGRRVFKLKNPNLPAKTPVKDTRLWVDIENLSKEVKGS